MYKCLFIISIILLSVSYDVAIASHKSKVPMKMNWSFNGMNGKFDRQAIQRGFKVFREVCASCHSASYLSFRDLSKIGFSLEEVKIIASEYNVEDGPDEEGQMYERAANFTESLPSPYKNDKEARVLNNGALPPDLSLMIKAREDGANYIYSLLTGFSTPEDDVILGENMHYNPYFISGNQLAMAPPLVSKQQVQYDDNTEASIEQMSWDVVNFLHWLAEPEMEERKTMGFQILVFMSIFTVLFYFANKKIWARLREHK